MMRRVLDVVPPSIREVSTITRSSPTPSAAAMPGRPSRDYRPRQPDPVGAGEFVVGEDSGPVGAMEVV